MCPEQNEGNFQDASENAHVLQESQDFVLCLTLQVGRETVVP